MLRPDLKERRSRLMSRLTLRECKPEVLYPELECHKARISSRNNPRSIQKTDVSRTKTCRDVKQTKTREISVSFLNESSINFKTDFQLDAGTSTGPYKEIDESSDIYNSFY